MNGYGAILVYLVVAAVMAATISFSSERFGPRAPGGLKRESYESGILPDRPVSHFSVRFYRVAMLFLIFDVSVMAIYPWATSIRAFHAAGFVKAMFFMVVLAIGFAYVWRRGGFKWD
ncbi:MAG: NADH-quinone oxidoreductase subunit A [Clostridia bacterium]